MNCPLHLSTEGVAGNGLGGARQTPGKAPETERAAALPGMLLHIDGSKHSWFGDERWYDLIVILEDATSEIYYAQLVEEESRRTVMAGLREVIETKGFFCALYSHQGSHFFVTTKAGEKVDKHHLTQVGFGGASAGVSARERPIQAKTANKNSGRAAGPHLVAAVSGSTCSS